MRGIGAVDENEDIVKRQGKKIEESVLSEMGTVVKIIEFQCPQHRSAAIKSFQTNQ